MRPLRYAFNSSLGKVGSNNPSFAYPIDTKAKVRYLRDITYTFAYDLDWHDKMIRI